MAKFSTACVTVEPALNLGSLLSAISYPVVIELTSHSHCQSIVSYKNPQLLLKYLRTNFHVLASANLTVWQ